MLKKTILGALALALVAAPSFADVPTRKSLQVLNDVAAQVPPVPPIHDFRRRERGGRQRYGHLERPCDDAIQERRPRSARRQSRWRRAGEERAGRAARLAVRRRIAVPDRARDLRQSVVLELRRDGEPPIHIVVENGRVTLTGTVNNNVERMLARSLAMTFGAFSITNNLKTDAEVQAMLEHVN